MLMAVFGDIHGNLPALNAALDAINEIGIQTVACTGDVVVGYPFPNEVIERMQADRIPIAQGKWDRLASTYARKQRRLLASLSDDEAAAVRETHETLTSAHIEFLRGLPARVEMRVEGLRVCVCHGAPASASEGMEGGMDTERLRRQREAMMADLIVCGQTHRPFAHLVDGSLFVNPGSLGAPVGAEPLGTFAIIDTDASPWQVDFREVRYDPAPIRALMGPGPAGSMRRPSWMG